MKRRADKEIFGTAFLDIISCAFGAIILVVILAQTADRKDSPSNQSPVVPVSTPIYLDTVLKGEVKKLESNFKSLVQRSKILEKRLSEISRDNENLDIALEAKNSNLKIKNEVGSIDSIYSGGIPVGQKYVIFIIDTSGSMKQNWSIVMGVMQDILSAHPQIRGFQILNDNGNYLIDGYSKKWIPDLPSARNRAFESLKNWNSFSNSSPAEGLETSLKTYAKRPGEVSIYVLGDDFTGDSYEQVAQVVYRWNVDKITGSRNAIIHGVGFSWGLGDRFSTLMRYIANENGGVFIGL